MLSPDIAADVYTDIQGLARLRKQAAEKTPESLREVAKQFESIFFGMMLKSMRHSSLGEGLLDSDQSRFYRDMYDQQLTVDLSGDPGLGLAELIVKQLGGETATEPGELKKDLDVYRASAGNSHTTTDAKHAGQTNDASAIDRNQEIAGETAFESPQVFIEKLRPLAAKAAAKLGIDPNLLMAQAALETGWGKSIVRQNKGGSSHNLFNIKADRSWQGGRAVVPTLEYVDGLAVKERAGFRAYESFEASFNDYADFIRRQPRYADALQHATKPEAYVNALQEAGYATDPEYAEKILSIYKRSEFQDIS